MTKFELILILTAILTTTWSGIVTTFARKAVCQYKRQVAYYQKPDTQIEIAMHVIENKFYKTGQETFK
jgi:hypothetical protein